MYFDIHYWEVKEHEPYLLGWNRNLIDFDLEKVKAYIQEALEYFDENEFEEWFDERVSEYVEVSNEQIDVKYDQTIRNCVAYVHKNFSVTVPLSEYSSELQGSVRCDGEYDHSIVVGSRDFEDSDRVLDALQEKVVEWRSQSTSKQEFIAFISKLDNSLGTTVFEDLKNTVEKINPNVLSSSQNMNMKNFTPENYTTVADEIEDALSSWESDDIPVAAYNKICGYVEYLNRHEREQAER